MEKIQSGMVIRRDQYHMDEINSCYDEFIRLKPDISVIGNVFYGLLEDAVTSLIRSLAKNGDNMVLYNNSDTIVNLTEKYARIYFAMGKEDRVLLMFRSALYDIIREYDINTRKYDTLTANLYESIRKLITV